MSVFFIVLAMHLEVDRAFRVRILSEPRVRVCQNTPDLIRLVFVFARLNNRSVLARCNCLPFIYRHDPPHLHDRTTGALFVKRQGCGRAVCCCCLVRGDSVVPNAWLCTHGLALSDFDYSICIYLFYFQPLKERALLAPFVL